MNKNEPMHNVTGGQLIPQDIEAMLEATERFPADVPGDEQKLAFERSKMVKEVDPIGTIPPMTEAQKDELKTASATKDMTLLIDKLGERLAFERSGVRLYEAAIAKAKGFNLPSAFLNRLEHIREEEAEHMAIVKTVMDQLGADATAITPCADVTSVAGMGLIQVMTDPRTDAAQLLNTLLIAELTDNAGWELLIELAMKQGQDVVAECFRIPLKQEQEHLLMIKNLLKETLKLDTEQASCYYLGEDERGWVIKKDGASRAIRHFDSKEEAVTVALKMSENAKARLVIRH
ncbi:hypothetical protein Lrub_1028 [Legionella rubrilucens]|uniref:Ferritin/DPS protein domain-containing protein n=1 Tax=Legionella rubrilucens TaxID=458 RepID=A0A0W0XVM7_9GAMM|nr:DUF2188 domain-containing protein [Legionella rubrilucens]KTD48677.1 hypothetical protein Lrub_1028 [Legionella rubrilucens]